MKRLGAPVLALAVLLPSAGCDPNPGLRDAGREHEIEDVRDIDDITVFRNYDNWPNIARVCADGVAFAVTRSADGAKSPSMVRVAEWDRKCPGGE